MKSSNLLIILLSLFSVITFATGNKISVKPNLEGLKLPEKYKDWRVISASHRTDNKSMRIILGNDVAIKASRLNQTNPWPEGTILGKLVWKQTNEKNWPTAISPEEFIHAEFMYKDTKKFKSFI